MIDFGDLMEPLDGADEGVGYFDSASPSPREVDGQLSTTNGLTGNSLAT